MNPAFRSRGTIDSQLCWHISNIDTGKGTHGVWNKNFQIFYWHDLFYRLRTRVNIFTDRLSKPQNQLHCVSWDHDMWSSIDCETSVDFSERPLVPNQEVSVNCTCLASSKVYAVIEETISDGHEYLETQTDSVIFR